LSFTKHDCNVVRGLAVHCRQIADSGRNQALRKRWTDLNDLCHAGPPLLMVSPEGAWREINATIQLECLDEMARGWELALRQRIYLHDVIRDDTAFEPVFTIGLPVTVSDYGIPFKQSKSDQALGAYHDEPVLTDLDTDLDKLHFRTISVDRAAGDTLLDLARETMGDILDVRPYPNFWWTCGLTWEAIKLLGLENLMLAMYDNPQGLHRLMKFLSDDMLNFITYFEWEGLLGYNTSGYHIGSGGLGYTSQLPDHDRPVKGPVLLKHRWGFSESQETVGVAPDMFGEFIFPHQLPLLERFGRNYYGCCEASEGRWEYLRKIPNLRCISVAPWSDQARCAELFGRNYVYCRKPNPTPVCMNFNEVEIRRDFTETLRHAGSLNTAMILKDTHTVENDPSRFARWVAIGREMLG